MNVVLRPAAERDIADAMAWYDAKEGGLGDRFLEQVAATFERVAIRPLGFPLTHGTFRRALVHRFPYTIYFREEGERIVIFAVYHQRRDPMQLGTRLRRS